MLLWLLSCPRVRSLPTNAHSEGSVVPISIGYDWHFPAGVGAWSVEYLMAVTVFGGVEFVRVGVGSMSVMGMLRRHDCCG